MITEDYCSFEISKLLKEKGFDGWCDYFYDDPRRQELRTKDGEDKYWNGHLWDDEYAAPTHQMAMKWLREKWIFIEISFSITIKGEPCYGFGILSRSAQWVYRHKQFFSTYEEAVEAAILYVLNKVL